MEFRLLIDMEVFDSLQALSPQRRSRFLKRFRQIQGFPGHYSDYVDQDEMGRRLDVALLDGMAVFYWVDVSDRHVKILKITAAD